MGNDASKGWHDFTSGVGDIFGAVTKPVTAAISGVEHIVTHGEDTLGGIANTVGNTVQGVGGTLGTTIQSLGKDASGAIQGVSHDVKDTVGGLGNDLSNVVSMPMLLIGGGVFALLFFTSRNNQVPQIIQAGGEAARGIRY